MTQIAQMTSEELNVLTHRIIACVYAVHSKLGCGFLEKVYENALCVELEKSGLKFETQKPVNVFYSGRLVGEFVCDLVIEDRVVVELKSVKTLTELHSAQCINYLKATGLPLCLLVNFGEARAKVKRFIKSASSAPSAAKENLSEKS